MYPHFTYLCWDRKEPNKNLRFHNDCRESVEVTTSVGPYKNNFGDLLMDKNGIHEWAIRILKGNYFKIGIIKQSQIPKLKNKSFSDISDGYSYYSTGYLRNGSNKEGDEFILKNYGPGDTVRVKFQPKKGKLSFAVNGSSFQVGFENQHFKKGGYVPAVGTLIEGSKYCLTLPEMQD